VDGWAVGEKKTAEREQGAERMSYYNKGQKIFLGLVTVILSSMGVFIGIVNLAQARIDFKVFGIVCFGWSVLMIYAGYREATRKLSQCLS